MSQMDLTHSYALKSPAQLERADSAIGLISLGELFSAMVGEHPSSLTDQASAERKLVDALEKTHQQNPLRPLRVLLNGLSSDALGQLANADSEPSEINPAMGLRGVSRYASEVGKAGFVFECMVLKEAIATKGLPVEVVVPFVRTSSEAATMIDLLAEQGLCRGANGLKVLLACQLPANAILAEALLAYFDGMIIDVDSLAAFTLGVDFDDAALPYQFNKGNEAVRTLVLDTIRKVQLADKPVQLLAQESDTTIIEMAEAANVSVVFH